MSAYRLRVYVAGPLSKGDRVQNVRIAVDTGVRLLKAGYAPLIPHLSNFVDPDDSLCGYEPWMETDAAWIAVAEALVRLPGESAGSDREVEQAYRLGIPVYYGVDDFLEMQESERETAAKEGTSFAAVE